MIPLSWWDYLGNYAIRLDKSRKYHGSDPRFAAARLRIDPYQDQVS